MEDEPAPEPADACWMTQFHELQQQQVTALIQQNENQKTQLEILAMQLEVERQRRLACHLVSDQVPAKRKVDADASMQQLLPSPQATALPVRNMQVQDFGMGDFSHAGQQDFGPLYPAFGTETPQRDRNRHSQQNYLQTQNKQANDNMRLPRITDLDSPDNRLLMALGGYDLPPFSLPCLSSPDLPILTNNRLNNYEHSSAYLTPKYPPIGPDSILRSNSCLANTTPSSPTGTSPRGKRPRLVGPALTEYSSLAAMNVLTDNSYHHGQQNQALQSYAADVGKLAFSLTRKDLEECIIELALREADISTAFYQNPAFGIEQKQGLVRSSLMSKLTRNDRNVAISSKDICPMTMGLSKGGELGSFGKVPLERMPLSISRRKRTL